MPYSNDQFVRNGIESRIREVEHYAYGKFRALIAAMGDTSCFYPKRAQRN